MRAYSQIDEDNIRDQALVEDWIRSGLLHAEQDQQIQTGLAVTLRRIPVALRAVLSLFTLLLVIASVALTMNLLRFPESRGAAIFGLSAAICVWLAWLAAKEIRLYRCGVEEALAVAAVILGVMAATTSLPPEITDQAGIVTGVMGSLGIYGLFRFRYALVASALLAGFAPFTFRAGPIAERVASLIIFTILFFCAGRIRQRSPGETTDADWTVVQVTAFAAFYVVLNLMITPRALGLGGAGSTGITSGTFYWLTYILAWIIPAAVLWRAIRERVRLMIDVSGAAILVSMATSKSYLGWTRQSWDPLVFGVLLIITAVVLRRRLARDGGAFTPFRLLDSETRASTAATVLALAVPQNVSSAATDSPSFKGGGGESGGGGASGSY